MKTDFKQTFLRSGLAALFLAALALSPAAAQTQPVRIGANVMQANLVSKVNPVYPAEAKQKHIDGLVKLEVTVDQDGHVSQIAVIGGPKELQQSATDAVRQWVYRPTLLNGQPVEVVTTVDVNYTLAD